MTWHRLGYHLTINGGPHEPRQQRIGAGAMAEALAEAKGLVAGGAARVEVWQKFADDLTTRDIPRRIYLVELKDGQVSVHHSHRPYDDVHNAALVAAWPNRAAEKRARKVAANARRPRVRLSGLAQP
jgi:hypothetical protein